MMVNEGTWSSTSTSTSTSTRTWTWTSTRTWTWTWTSTWSSTRTSTHQLSGKCESIWQESKKTKSRKMIFFLKIAFRFKFAMQNAFKSEISPATGFLAHFELLRWDFVVVFCIHECLQQEQTNLILEVLRVLWKSLRLDSPTALTTNMQTINLELEFFQQGGEKNKRYFLQFRQSHKTRSSYSYEVWQKHSTELSCVASTAHNWLFSRALPPFIRPPDQSGVEISAERVSVDKALLGFELRRCGWGECE